MVGWNLTPKEKLRVGKNNIFPDGTLRDLFTRRGFWEAKDTDDVLDQESRRKSPRAIDGHHLRRYPAGGAPRESVRAAPGDSYPSGQSQRPGLGDRISTKSTRTSAAASAPTPTAPTTKSTSSAWSAK
jgi:hypothetical protein